MFEICVWNGPAAEYVGAVANGLVVEPAAIVIKGILIIGVPVPAMFITDIGHITASAVPSAIVVTGTYTLYDI